MTIKVNGFPRKDPYPQYLNDFLMIIVDCLAEESGFPGLLVSLVAAYLPPLPDCAAVYSAGGTDPGYYHLEGDPYKRSPPRLHYCEEGWTHILSRAKLASGAYRTVSSD